MTQGHYNYLLFMSLLGQYFFQKVSIYFKAMFERAEKKKKMANFTFDLHEYENRGTCTGKRFQYITLATKNT